MTDLPIGTRIRVNDPRHPHHNEIGVIVDPSAYQFDGEYTVDFPGEDEHYFVKKHFAVVVDNYQVSLERSFSVEDIARIFEVSTAAQKFVDSVGVSTVSVEVYDAANSRLLGELWFDSENEKMQFDPARFGEK